MRSSCFPQAGTKIVLQQSARSDSQGKGILKMAPEVALVFFTGCPHVQTARERLRSALKATGLPIEWTEWETSQVAAPTELRGFGSPAVFVDRLNVMGDKPEMGMTCAVTGAPSLAILVAALTTRAT